MENNKKWIRWYHTPYQWAIPFMFTGLLLTSACTGEKKTANEKNIPQEKLQKNEPTHILEEPFSISYLFTDASEFKYIDPAFSADSSSGAPWEIKHLGIDLITAAENGTCLLVPADGKVQQVVMYLNPKNNQWQMNLHIRYDDRFSYNLFIEPRAHTAEQIAIQRAAIPVHENDQVTAGDTLGTILNLSSEETGFSDVTVHFEVCVDSENVCPEPYFKPEVLTAILSLLHAKYPDGKLCYLSTPTTTSVAIP
jgi:hypothetical protein